MILTNFTSSYLNLGNIFQSQGCLSGDVLGFQWNWERKTFWTLTFKLLDRIIALLYFKTERVAGTALRASWFWQTSAQSPGTWGIFWCPGHYKQSADVAWFAVEWTQQNFLNFHFLASGPKYSPIDFKNERVDETALRASWFWQNSARFPRTWGIFSSPEDS